MNKKQTIEKFHLYMDDTSELSSTEEAALYDKIVGKVAMSRPWEKLKKEAVGTVSGVEIPFPDRFLFVTPSTGYTEHYEEAGEPAVFVDGRCYKIVSFSDRRQYLNRDGYCYVDLASEKIIFTDNSAASKGYSFDYQEMPEKLTDLEGTPWIPEDYRDIIYHGMCVDDFVIQQSEKARSYQRENQVMYDNYMEDLAWWNSNLVQLT